MTPEAPTTIPANATYPEAEAIARRMSDQDLLSLAGGLSSDHCSTPEVAANHEVNRRFERLREQSHRLSKSMETLNDKHDLLQERFDKLFTVLQRVLALLAGPSTRPADPAGPDDAGGDPQLEASNDRSALAS